MYLLQFCYFDPMVVCNLWAFFFLSPFVLVFQATFPVLILALRAFVVRSCLRCEFSSDEEGDEEDAE